jgi:hypothetical protein
MIGGRMMRSRWLVVPLALPLLAGCRGGATVRMLEDGPKRAKVCSQGVRVFNREGEVPGTARRIAEVGTTTRTEREALDRLVRKAGDVGANGLLLSGAPRDRSPGGGITTAPPRGEPGGVQTTPRDDVAYERQGIALYIPSDTTRVREACGS